MAINLNAIGQGVESGVRAGSQILQNRRLDEQQVWRRYEYEKQVAGDKLNAVMNTLQNVYNGDIGAMGASQAGANMMMDVIRDDPAFAAELNSNPGWSVAGVYQDGATGRYAFVVEDENGDRKPLTVDRRSGTAPFSISEDEFYGVFAAAAGRAGVKDTLTLTRMMKMADNLEDPDQREFAKNALTNGQTSAFPSRGSLSQVSAAARKNNRGSYPTEENQPTAAVRVPEKSTAVEDTISQAVQLGVVGAKDGDSLRKDWDAGKISSTEVADRLEGVLGRTPSDRIVAMNRLVSAQATPDDLAFEEGGVAPSYNIFPQLGGSTGGQSQPTDPTSKEAILGGVSSAGRAGANALSNLSGVAKTASVPGIIYSSAKAMADSAKAKVPDHFDRTIENGSKQLAAMRDGDWKGLAKAVGEEVSLVGSAVKALAEGYADHASEGLSSLTGVVGSFLDGVRGENSPEMAKAVVSATEAKAAPAVAEADVPEGAKQEVLSGRVKQSTINDPDKLENTQQAYGAKLSSMTPAERVLSDEAMYYEAMKPYKKRTAKQRGAVIQLYMSGAIFEDTMRTYLSTGEWSMQAREHAVKTLALRRLEVQERAADLRANRSYNQEALKMVKQQYTERVSQSANMVMEAALENANMGQYLERSGEDLRQYSENLLKTYLADPRVMQRFGVNDVYGYAQIPEAVDAIARNIAAGIRNKTISYREQKTTPSSLWNLYGLIAPDDVSGESPFDLIQRSNEISRWFSKGEQQ